MRASHDNGKLYAYVHNYFSNGFVLELSQHNLSRRIIHNTPKLLVTFYEIQISRDVCTYVHTHSCTYVML